MLQVYCLVFASDSPFMATLSQPAVDMTGFHSVIPWDNARIDLENNFDVSQHGYITPVDGYYLLVRN